MRTNYHLFTRFLAMLSLLFFFSFSAASATLSESFEGTMFPPTSWQLNDEGTAWTHKTTGTVPDGSKCAYINKAAYDNARLITPKLVIDGSSSINFYLKSASFNNTMTIQYSSDLSAWTDIETVSCAAIYVDEAFNVDLSGVPAGNYYIAFKAKCTDASWSWAEFYLDNITGPKIYVNPNPEISLDIENYNFDLAEKGTSSSYTLTINNTGGADLTFTAPTVSSPFSCTTPTTISAGGSTTVDITFDTSVAGSFNETLTFNCNASNSDYIINLSGAIYESGALLEDFESVSSVPPLGWEATTEGSWNVETTEVFAGSKSAKFYKNGTYADERYISPKLQPANQDFIMFQAKTGAVANAIQVQYSTDKLTWTNIGSPITLSDSYVNYLVDLSSLSGKFYIALSCSSTANDFNYVYLDNIVLPELYVSIVPEISISPMNYDFGDIYMPETENTTVTIQNVGGADLVITDIADIVSYSTDFVGPVTVTPGNAKYITVTANGAGAGIATESFSVTSNSQDGANTFELTANFIAAEGYPLTETFDDDPVAWEIGYWYTSTQDVYEGTKAIYTSSTSNSLTSKWIDLTGVAPRMKFFCKNSDDVKDLIIKITEDGTNYTEVTTVSVPIAWTEKTIDLSAYSNKIVKIQFTSAADQYGSKTFIDILKIEETPTIPVYTFNQSEFSYGTVYLGENSSISASIANDGVSTVDISTIEISGTNADEFSLSAMTLPANIDNSSSFDFDVVFTPTAAGTKTAMLTITEIGGTVHDYTITSECIDATIYSLPFNENFDALTAPNLPGGWDKILSGESGSEYLGSYTHNSYANSGSNSVKIYGANATDGRQVLILPVSSLDITTTELSLWQFGSYEFQVGYMTDKNDYATFNAVESFEGTYNYTNYVVNFGRVDISGSYYLAISVPLSSATIYIDDIEWRVDADAPIATLSPANADTDVSPYVNPIISFDEKVYKNGGDAISNVDLAAMLTFKETDAAGDDVPYSAEFRNDSIIVTPTNLLNYTNNYYLALKADQVQDKAGNKNVLNESSFTIMTAPTTVSAPMSESFEGTWIPDNWSQTGYYSYGTFYCWAKYDGVDVTYPDGTAAAKYSSSSNKGYDELSSPIIDISTLERPILSFDYNILDITGDFEIKITTDLGASYESLFSTTTTTSDWKNIYKRLDGNDFVQVVFEGRNSAFAAVDILLDNFKIENAPADPVFTITHTDYDFGTITINETETVDITVSNTGGQTITVDDVRIEGTNAADFSVTGFTSSVDITTNTLELVVTYEPTTGGAKTAKLVVEEADGTTHDVNLTGDCFDPEIRTLPYAENFDLTPEDNIPTGWYSIVEPTDPANTSAYVRVSSNSSAPSSPNDIRIYGGNSAGDYLAILPVTNLDLENAFFKYKAWGQPGTEAIVGYMTDPTDASTFTALETKPVEGYSVTQFEVALDGIVTSGAYHIAVKLGNTSNTFKLLYMDDFAITSNNTPEFTSAAVETVHIGELYNYNITTIDADDDALTITQNYMPTWATLTDNGDGTALLTGTPDALSNPDVTLVVTDGESEATQVFRIDVTNEKPVFTTTPVTEVEINTAYAYIVEATDADNDPVTLSMTAGPSWLSFTTTDGVSTLAGTPTEAGKSYVTIEANDTFEKTEQIFQLEVFKINVAPEFTSDSITEVVINTEYVYNITAIDSNDDDIVFIDSVVPTWLTLTDNEDGTATLKGTMTEMLTFDVIIGATDGEDTTLQKFVIEVVAVLNNKPEITSLPELKGKVNLLYAYTITATDVDGDSLAYDFVTLPEWLKITDTVYHRAVAGIPDTLGSYDVKLFVADHKDTVYQEFTIVVDSIANTAPVFATEPIMLANQYEDYLYRFSATDANEHDLTFFSDTLPTWLKLGDNKDGTGAISGTPLLAGRNHVVIGVTDGIDTTYQTFDIAVKATDNVAPEFTSIPLTKSVKDKQYVYDVVVTDADGDVIEIGGVKLPGWLLLTDNGDGTAKLSGVSTTVGSIDVSLYASDSKETVYQNFKITVEADGDNNAPEFTSDPVTEVLVDKVYSYSIVVTDADDDGITLFAENLPTWLTLTDNEDGTGTLTGTPTEKGTFKIELFAADFADTTKQQFEITVDPVGIFDAQGLDVNVYPNPASNRVFVDMNKTGQIQLFDNSGRMISTTEAREGVNEIITDDLSSGYYLVKVIAGNNYEVKKISIIR